MPSHNYSNAALVLEGVSKRRGSAKSLTMRLNHRANKAIVLKLSSETLRHSEVLHALLDRCPSLSAQRPSLLLVMLYDLLFGRGIEGGGALKKSLKAHESTLRAALGSPEIVALMPAAVISLPRYARVNTLKASVSEIFESLRAEFGERVAVDSTLPYLLVFPSGTDLHDHPFVRNGQIILQEKASCFPPAEIDRARRIVMTSPFDVIDACAAPGNKTSQMAALLATDDKSGVANRVIAFDKSPARLGLLRRRMSEAGAAKRVQATLRDFLDTKPSEPQFKSVRAILLDPSCSGSGMRGTWARQDKRSESKSVASDDGDERLRRLAAFQLSALLHAMSFPQVEIITYSTCSIHAMENESVVAAALARQPTLDTEDPKGRFVLQRALPEWPTRGRPFDGLSEKQSDCLVRSNMESDRTMGFFLASFCRLKDSQAQTTTGKRKRGAEATAQGACVNKTDRLRRKKRKNSAKRRERDRKRRACEDSAQSNSA